MCHLCQLGCCRSSPLLWLAICFYIGCLIYACIPDVSVVCQYAHFNFIMLALMGYYLYVLLVKAIVFSCPCLALGCASLCTSLEACYSLAIIARRLPGAFILVYLVHLHAVPSLYLGAYLLYLVCLCMLVCPLCCTGWWWVYYLPNAFVRFRLGTCSLRPHTCFV